MNDTPPTSEEMQKLLEHVESYCPTLLQNLLRDLETAKGGNVNKTRYSAKALLEDDLPLMLSYLRTLERDKKVLWDALFFVKHHSLEIAITDKAEEALASVTPPL